MEALEREGADEASWMLLGLEVISSKERFDKLELIPLKWRRTMEDLTAEYKVMRGVDE